MFTETHHAFFFLKPLEDRAVRARGLAGTIHLLYYHARPLPSLGTPPPPPVLTPAFSSDRPPPKSAEPGGERS